MKIHQDIGFKISFLWIDEDLVTFSVGRQVPISAQAHNYSTRLCTAPLLVIHIV